MGNAFQKGEQIPDESFKIQNDKVEVWEFQVKGATACSNEKSKSNKKSVNLASTIVIQSFGFNPLHIYNA